MRILITGGAGFIGGHLAEALLDGGHQVLVARRPVDRLDRQHRCTSRGARASTTPSTRSSTTRVVAELVDRADVDLPPGRGGRRQADRAGAGAHHRDQRARHRGGPAARGQEAEAGVHRLDLRGLRQEHRGAVPRGRRPRDGRDQPASLGVCLQQGARRVPGAGLLEAEAGCRSSSSASSTPSARGRRRATAWCCRRSCARRSPASRSPCSATARSRAASPTSATWSARSLKLMVEPKAIGQVINVGNPQEVTIRELAERIKRATGSARRRS